MDGTTVVFIELNTPNKFRHTCDIVEKIYDLGKTATIYVQDIKNAHTLDRQLWVWKQELFIPHVVLDSFDGEIEEAIIITPRNDFPAVTDTLILFDPLEEHQFQSFQLVVDFAEVYDAGRLKLSRDRYKTWRDTNQYQMEFFKLGAFLGTFKA